MELIIAASVVDLPEPVGPVTRIRPRLRCVSFSMTRGKVQVLNRRNFGRDDAERRRDRAFIPEDVDAEAGGSTERIRKVQFVGGFKLLNLFVGQNIVDHALRCLRRKRLHTGPVSNRRPRAAPGGSPTAICRSEAFVCTTRCSSSSMCVSSSDASRCGGAAGAGTGGGIVCGTGGAAGADAGPSYCHTVKLLLKNTSDRGISPRVSLAKEGKLQRKIRDGAGAHSCAPERGR